MRIEKNPGLGFSISGGISGQGNPFKPSDKVRSEFIVDNFSFKNAVIHCDMVANESHHREYVCCAEMI